MTSPMGTPTRAQSALPMRKIPAQTMFGMLPGISIPPETAIETRAGRR